MSVSRNPESSAPESIVREVIERWRSGARPDAALFLSANPDVRERKTLAMDLIYEEYCLRNEAGETLVPSTFCKKFPSYRQSLQRLIDVHQFLDAHPEDATNPDWKWPEPGETVLGFKIIQKLGEGAIARVYLAQQPDLGQRRVVVKISRHGTTEAKLLGKLEHPSIVPVHSVHQDAASGLTCICMPFLGTATLVDLHDMAFSQGRPPQTAEILRTVARHYQSLGFRETDEPSQAALPRESYAEGILRLGVQMAQALAAAHDAGIMHRDIKPSNVLLSRSGRPMLLDFNLSTDLEMPLERVGGTVAYMAPERIRCLIANDVKSESKIDPRSDVYSLAAVLYELLCGELPSRPQAAPEKQARLEEWLKGRLAPPPAPSSRNPQVDRHMDKVLLKALHPNSLDRYRSAADFAKALKELLGWKARTLRWAKCNRRSLLAGATALCAAFVTAAAIWATSPSYEETVFSRGETAYVKGDSKAAVDSFTSILLRNPESPQALFARGQANRQARKYFEAQQDFQAAYNKTKNARLLFYVGAAYLRLGSHDPARGTFELAIKEGQADPRFLHNIAYCMSRSKQTTEAVIRLEALVEKHPDLYLSHHLCARLQLDGTFSEGIPVAESTKQHLRKAEEGITNDPLLDLDIARMYAYSSKHTKSSEEEALALAYLRKAIKNGVSKRPIMIERELSQSYLTKLTTQEQADLEKVELKLLSTPLYYEPPAGTSLPALP